MLNTILGWVQKTLKPASYTEQLEQFIISKNPASPGDVEYWARVFDQRNSGGFYGR